LKHEEEVSTLEATRLQYTLAHSGPAPRTIRIQDGESGFKFDGNNTVALSSSVVATARPSPQPRPVARPSHARVERVGSDPTSLHRHPPLSSVQRRPASQPIAISDRVMERVLENERAEDEVVQHCNSADEQMYLRLLQARRPVAAPGGEPGEPLYAPPLPRSGGMITRKRSSAELLFMMDALDV
jgi:hypothetical protein